VRVQRAASTGRRSPTAPCAPSSAQCSSSSILYGHLGGEHHSARNPCWQSTGTARVVPGSGSGGGLGGGRHAARLGGPPCRRGVRREPFFECSPLCAAPPLFGGGDGRGEAGRGGARRGGGGAVRRWSSAPRCGAFRAHTRARAGGWGAMQRAPREGASAAVPEWQSLGRLGSVSDRRLAHLRRHGGGRR
jgi:hypothetical protein